MTPEQIKAIQQEYHSESPLEQARRFARGLKELEANPAWFACLGPTLAKLAEEAAAKHESTDLTAEGRAEWLYAMKKLRELKECAARRLETMKTSAKAES